MDSLSRAATALLRLQGINVMVDPKGKFAYICIVTLTNGDEYEILGSGLIKLITDKKLNAAGIAEVGTRKVQ